MARPKLCPVCSQDGIQAVKRTALGPADCDTSPISGVLYYRCSNGHTFVAADDKSDNGDKRPATEKPRSKQQR